LGWDRPVRRRHAWADYFARLGVDAEVDPEALPIEQRFIDDGMAKLEKLLRDHS
jgi:hypothetical protein